MRNILSLEEFRDKINESSEWSIDFNQIIKESGWEDETNTQFGICKDGNRRLEFNSNMEAEIIYIE